MRRIGTGQDGWRCVRVHLDPHRAAETAAKLNEPAWSALDEGQGGPANVIVIGEAMDKYGGGLEIESLRERFASLSPHLGERARRLFAATEAKALGRGGIKIVSRLTGMAASTIGRGLRPM